MAKQNFFATRTWKQIVNVSYNVGASIVIIGAMFKIIHFPGGDIVIGVGLVAEAILFMLTALDPLPYEYHWENVYPEVVDAKMDDPFAKQGAPRRAVADNTGLSEKIDKILHDANIDYKLFEGLRKSIGELSQTTSELSNVGAVGKDAIAYAAQLADASKKVEALNKLYEMQIESTSAHVNANRQIIDDMEKTLLDTRKLHSEVGSLAKNLEGLNSIYGGMLSVMGGRKE